MKIFLKLSYLGTDFFGYQVQNNKRTVQGELNRAAKELFGYECDITGCSRTDSGVHANMFCAAVSKHGESSLKTDINADRIPRAINAHLPNDISVLSAEWVDDGFHPRYDVKYKEYVYRIYNGYVRSPFEDGRAWHISRRLPDGAVERMNEAAQAFVGKKDFSAFMSHGSQVESTVRNVIYADVKAFDDLILFRVAADGFLYNMVRIMTGTLVDVALGKLLPSDIEKIIISQRRELAGVTAPPHGLYLNKVEY